MYIYVLFFLLFSYRYVKKKWGKYGPALEKEANRIEGMSIVWFPLVFFPLASLHCISYHVFFPIHKSWRTSRTCLYLSKIRKYPIMYEYSLIPSRLLSFSFIALYLISCLPIHIIYIFSNTFDTDLLLFLLHSFFCHVSQSLQYVKTQETVGSQRFYVSNMMENQVTIPTRVVTALVLTLQNRINVMYMKAMNIMLMKPNLVTVKRTVNGSYSKEILHQHVKPKT